MRIGFLFSLSEEEVDAAEGPALAAPARSLARERDGEADQEHGLDQNDRKFQVSRDAAGYTFMVCHWVAAFPKTPEDKKEKRRPAEEERAHEPMTELDDVIDLQPMR